MSQLGTSLTRDMEGAVWVGAKWGVGERGDAAGPTAGRTGEAVARGTRERQPFVAAPAWREGFWESGVVGHERLVLVDGAMVTGLHPRPRCEVTVPRDQDRGQH